MHDTIIWFQAYRRASVASAVMEASGSSDAVMSGRVDVARSLHLLAAQGDTESLMALVEDEEGLGGAGVDLVC